MAMTFPSDAQRGTPAWLTKFTGLLLRARYRTTVGDSTAAGRVPLVIQGAPSQTANLLEIYDGSKNGLGGVDARGFGIDANGLARFCANGTTKTIANASATALFDVACLASGMSGGMIFYTVEATDGTDYQSFTSMVSYSVVNKAATLTLTITEVAGNQAKALSTGTETMAWTFVTGTLKGTVKVQPTTSLTITAHRITYTVLPLIGAITIL